MSRSVPNAMNVAAQPLTHPDRAFSVEQLLAKPKVQEAFEYFEGCEEEITREQMAICSIPAPPFNELVRAQYLRERFIETGLQDTVIDEEGNCIAVRSGDAQKPLVVVSAHLDTVFPASTDFLVRRVGNKLFGPGVSDDGCGLAALIALTRVFQSLQISTSGSLLFVGSVGEEGEGNLRGVQHLCTKGKWAGKIDAFISFDGPGVEYITNRALASRRYRIRARGAGGHSWADFGTANPVQALGRAIAKLATYPTHMHPRTTFNVARIVGGTSVNAIPTEALMDVDLRSATDEGLVRLDAFFRRAIQEATDDENSAARKDSRPLNMAVDLIGERPGGETPESSGLVQLALEATRMLGFKPQLEQASTDSNLPMSLGIPAITLGAGGTSANSHTLEEWYDATNRVAGLKRALLVILGSAGIGEIS